MSTTAAATLTAADANPLGAPLSRDIPTTFGASFKSWWASGEKQSALSEERLLSRLPFYTPTWARNTTTEDPSQPVKSSIDLVHLDTPKRYLNTFSILPNTPSDVRQRSPEYPPTVLLPGYGAGIGFFFLNFPSLASWVSKTRAPVYAVDWLGMGRSARVPFTVKSKREDVAGRVHEAESFFIDSLEVWRQKQGIEQMALIGHSLGGYLACAYALRYPTRVSRLILLSPAGIPHDPDTMNPADELTEPSPPAKDSRRGSVERPSPERVRNMHTAVKEKKKNESTLRRMGTYLWEEGWSPFQIVRSTLFWGPMLVGKYSSRRFAHLPEEDVRNMHDYIWHITSAKGSGEYCISHLLAPGAHARLPMVDRVDKLKIPIAFIYGDHDWMDSKGGEDSVKKMKEAGNKDGRLYVVENAGHHVYLDNPKNVDQLILDELTRKPSV